MKILKRLRLQINFSNSGSSKRKINDMKILLVTNDFIEEFSCLIIYLSFKTKTIRELLNSFKLTKFW